MHIKIFLAVIGIFLLNTLENILLTAGVVSDTPAMSFIIIFVIFPLILFLTLPFLTFVPLAGGLNAFREWFLAFAIGGIIMTFVFFWLWPNFIQPML